MDIQVPTKQCAACLWVTQNPCKKCMFRKIVNTEKLGVIQIVTSRCARQTEKCPNGVSIDKNFLWESEEVL